MAEELDDYMDDPAVKALFGTAADRKDVQEAFALRMPAYAAMVEGSLKLDLQKLKKDFAREVGAQRKIKQAAIDAQKAKEFNSKRAAPAATTPVVGTKGSVATGSTGKKFQTKEEYQKWAGLV